MNKETLVKIIGSIYSDETLEQIVDSLNQVFEIYKINTKLRQNHFLAQILHESGAFRYKEEIASGDAYDTRADLGNTPQKDGDGRLYKGRGWIQITGKNNYRKASKEFGIDFVNNPKLASEYPFCALLAGWYWNKCNLNAMADKNFFKSITKAINGGYNGINDRLKWYEICHKNNI